MRLTQGAFSFLPDLTDEQIKMQVEYCISKGWSVNIEWTDDPHPRNVYWELWGLPLFDIKDPAAVMYELGECRKANTTGYIKMNAFDASIGTESCVSSFIIQRPSYEPVRARFLPISYGAHWSYDPLHNQLLLNSR
mgnify:CR=1 FL=1